MPRAATIRLSLCFFLIVLFLLFFSGCHSQTPEIGEYPVIVNGKAVAVHPEKVVSLSPACTAYALLKGYPLYGVSGQCAQWVSQAEGYPVFGSVIAPDVEQMKGEGVDMVLSASKLLESDRQKLEQAGISYVELTPPEELLGLVAWYSDIGGVFAGSLGQQDGADTAALLVKQMQQQAMKMVDPEDPITVLCFSGDLSHSVPDSGFLGYLFTLFDLQNLSSDDGLVEPEQLILEQPDYLLVDSEQLLQEIRENERLNGLDAVKAGRVYVIELSSIRLFLPQMLEQTQAFLEMVPLTDS